MTEPPPVTIAQTKEILTRLERHVGEIVLIGGQAVNAWAGQFLDAAPALEAFGPYASKDTDFQADVGVVQACARDLGEELTHVQRELSEDFIGYVDFPTREGACRVDFLRSPLGLAALDVSRLAVEAEVCGARVCLMHPLHCLISRAENVIVKPEKYDTEHGNRQLRAAMVSLTCFLRAASDAGNTREALDVIEALAKYCNGLTARNLFEAKGLDLFSTVTPDLELPTAFWERRYPQLVKRIGRQGQRS